MFDDYIPNVNLFSRHRDTLGRGALDFYQRKFWLNSTDDVRYFPKSLSCPMSWSQVSGSWNASTVLYFPCSLWFLFPYKRDVMRHLLEHILCGEVLHKLYSSFCNGCPRTQHSVTQLETDIAISFGTILFPLFHGVAIQRILVIGDAPFIMCTLCVIEMSGAIF